MDFALFFSNYGLIILLVLLLVFMFWSSRRRMQKQKLEQAIELAEGIQAAESVTDAAEMLTELTGLTDAILNGVDADGNGRVGWQEGEGGLAQAATHMGLIKRAEGLGN